MRRLAARPLLIAATALAVVVVGSAVAPSSGHPHDPRGSSWIGRVDAAPAPLSDRVSVAVAKRRHKTVRHSIGVWDAATGRRLYMLNADAPRRTASVMKLATTTAALIALGANHEMAIEIRATAAPSRGVVAGDLVVEGTGDPGLSSHLEEDGADAALRRLAAAVRAAGVDRVDGDLVLDTSAFTGPDRHPGWGWKPGEYAWYMAPVSALTIADGCVDVTARPRGAPGTPATLSVSPRGAPVTFVNGLTSTRSKKEHKVAFYAPDSEGRIRVKGKVVQEYTTSIACVDPPEVLGAALRVALTEAGVQIGGPTRVVRGPPAEPWPRAAERPGVIVARHSTSLAEAVRVTNRRSQNLWAELILRSLGAFGAGPDEAADGTFEGGARAVRRVIWPGGDAPDAFRQEDGSGLSRGNVSTVGALADVVFRAYRSDHRLIFMESLAKGGEAGGTLRKRFKEKRFEGRVLAKTGTLRDTSALAGFVRADGGRVLIFVILCEGPVWRSRELQDAVVGALLQG